MADLSSIYNFYYMNPGDRWYPGFDEENMRIADNQFSSMAKYIGTCVGTGWTVVKLSEERSEQLALLGSYLLEPSSEYSQKLINLNLNFPSSNVVSAGTTESINLSGGAPNTLDGINLQTNDKILVKDQNDKSENGVYYISDLGIGANGTWLRDQILNESDDFNSNFLVYVSGGVANTSTLWIGASLGMTFGTNNLYFVNAFNQCVKVYPGDGIVDIFYGKTEKPYFFRFNNEDDHYVWAEKTLNIEYNNACKIVAPEEPSLNYGAANNATYLATIVSSVGSTLYDLATIDSIVYGPNRRQFLDFNGEYQSLLKNNFQNHKHLSDFRSAIKINLQNYTILNAVNRFQDVLKISSTVFVLENEDGTLFTENLSNYGMPLVYLDDTLLKKEQYYFKFEDSINKLFLKNSISTNQGLKIYLPNFLQKELICIDVNGTLLTSAISTITPEVLLSDSELEDRSPDDSLENLVFKNFQWNKVDYKDAEVYINGNLIQKKYYDINPYNGTIKILSSLPNYNSYFYDQLIIKLNRVGSEIQNSLTFENISDVDASTFDKGKIPQSKIKNLNHNYNTRYKINATYKFDKFLLSGLGNSYYYPENSISDLQYNTNVNGLFFSNNINNGYISLTEHGLMNSSESFTNIKFIDTWNNDDGKPIQLIDDLLIPESENLLETTYVLTSDGKVFYSNDKFTTWQEFDLPFAENSKRVIVNTFDLSTDREEISLGQFQNSTYVYLGTDFGLYETRILEGQTQFEWSWSELSTYVNDDIVDLKNINKVKEISTKNILIESGVTDIITYDRHLYVGSSDPDNPGLYFGDNNFVKRIFTENVKGITWIQTDISKSNKNNIIWWNDYDVYLTHTARFIENESGSYWEHPFEIEASPLSDCVCATVGNITLSGLQTIDGYTVSSGQRVLVKNQTDKTQNGIYLANSSSWSRATDFDEDSDLSYLINVTILNGSENANTIWFLKYQDLYEIGMTNIEWDIFKKKIFSTSTPSYTATRSIIKNVIVRNSNLNNLEYLVIYDNGVSLIEEGNVFIVKDLIYDPLFQGSINNALSLNSTNFTGILYIATENGIYKSTEFLWKDKDTITDINLEIDPWIRTENVFTFNDSVLLINNANGNEIISYDKYYQWQLFHLQENIDIGSSISYEKDFRNFYINPWYFDFLDDQGAPIKHTVVVYVNNKPTTIPYITDSTTGLIQFVSSIDKKYYENVTISIFCNNQFLNNVGSLTHNEIFTPANSEIAIARLSLENNIDDLKLYLNQDINNNEKILRLDDGVQQEIVYISSIDNFSSPVEVTLTATRSSSNSTHTFSAGTTVYSIKDKLSNNIQDSLYNLVSKERYNLGSLNNINTNKMISKIDDEISNVFQITPSAPFSQNDTRGFINLKYTNDFVNDNIYDDTISITKHNIGTPDLFISENYEINNIYDIANLSKTADNSILLTDKGIWIYNDYRWELSYPTQNVVFYNIEQYNNQYKISSSNGIYIVDENFNITIDDDFKSEINNYYNGFFDNINCEVYSKDDGFVLVKNPDSSSFISEYSSLLDSKKVFSTNKYQGLRVSDSSLNLYDILVVCASDGAYGICTGENDDIFANSLVTRKLFDMPSDVARIYKSFSPNQIPTIPVNDNLNNYLFLLTNNGLIRINNFRLCDPNIVGGLTFYQDNKFLTSLDCLCFLLDSEEAIDKNNPGKSKIFIGTNKGVYRSLDGGNSFEPAERFQNKLPLVNSLRIVKTNFISGTESIEKNVIVACTNIGLYYSIDDGDNWYKCNEQTSISEEPVNFSYYPSNFIEFSQNNTSNYLSQTFRCPNSADIIDKISVLLSIDKNKVNDTNYQSSFNNNYIEVSLCALDVNDKPDLSSILATSSSGSVFIKNLKENNFEYFQFNLSTSSNQKIALVIREVVTAGGISLLKWKKSQNYNLDYFGKSYTRYDGSWVKLDNSDNQLTHRIFFSSSLQPVENIVPVGVDSNGNVGWHLGKSRGLLIDDSGELVSDIRFLVSLLIDDTKSMGRILSKFDFNTKIKNLIETLFDRSERIVGSETLNFTAIDILSLNNQLVNLTNNIFSNQKSDILNTINDLRNTGTFTGLLNGLEIASHGLFKNSVNAAMGNQIEDVITYLDNESLLRINDIIEQYNSYELDDDWDESINTIPDSEIATKLTLDSFADSYIPLLICLTDGENVSDNIIQDLKFYLNNYWDKNGFKLILFNLGKNKWQDDFYDLVYGTDSIHFQLNNSNDLQNAIDSLFHGELNNIFQSKWDRKFIYDEPKYISRIYTSYTVSTIETINSECDVQFRYSTDYENFTEWFSLSNNINFNLDKKITNIEYKVLMKEGWNGSPVKPSIQELYHVEVEPANAYLFSDVFEIDGYLNEYIISSNTSAVDFDLQFFISRENSNNLVDFFDVITNRNSVLPNRQKEYKATDEVIYENLILNPINDDFFEFEILKDGKVFKWNENYNEFVILNSNIIDSGNYRIDNNSGIIIFDQILENYQNITIKIVELSNTYISFGESTKTHDYCTYYAVNGSWKYNDNVVIFINNEIYRKNYILDNLSGSVTFYTKLDKSDIVTIYVQHPQTFKLCTKITSYDSTLPSLINFDVQYNTSKNLNKISELQVVSKPYILDNRPRLKSSLNTVSNSLSINYPIHIEYFFASDFDTDENETITSWWIQKDIFFYEILEYTNRIIQKQSDLKALGSLFELGNEVYVKVQPKDKYKTGLTFNSENFVLSNLIKPFVYDVKIKTSSTIVNNRVQQNTELQSAYFYVSNIADASIIEWYDWSISNTPIYTGRSLPSSYVKSGSIISYKITPFDGTTYGDVVYSNYIYVF